jgi:hypothetical protein
MGTSQQGIFVNLLEPVTWTGKDATVECKNLVRSPVSWYSLMSFTISVYSTEREPDSDRKRDVERHWKLIKNTFSFCSSSIILGVEGSCRSTRDASRYPRLLNRVPGIGSNDIK